MSITITLETLHIIGGWRVNLADERVEVNYELQDAESRPWSNGIAYFWRTTPLDDEGNPLDPLPDNYFIMDSTIFDNLLAAHQAIKAEMETRFLEVQP